MHVLGAGTEAVVNMEIRINEETVVGGTNEGQTEAEVKFDPVRPLDPNHRIWCAHQLYEEVPPDVVSRVIQYSCLSGTVHPHCL